MNTLILIDPSAELAARLAHQGWSGYQLGGESGKGWQALASLDEAAWLPAPRLWLVASDRQLPVGEADLLLTSRPSVQASPCVGLSWQASPFAVEHGFLLMAGGPAELIHRAEAILDALAPSPGAWLHAGGISAPTFMTQVMSECGGGLAGLAPLFLANPASGLDPFWQGQYQLSARLAQLASDYLVASADEHYQPVHALPPVFALTPPNSQANDSPARKLAALLLWLYQHQPGN
ncbi:hypothetical protein [Chitinimonas sp.]|uniref:hypothetical protein n=1 Tax=Chitinimonas sp. TaxID=1934313 RepID=UPI002F929290